MIRTAVPTIALVLVLALSACKGEEKPAQGARAEGEVLPGTASDAMIPYDTLRSQPPLAPKPVATGKPGAKADEDAEGEEADAEAAPSDAPVVSVPAATPSGE